MPADPGAIRPEEIPPEWVAAAEAHYSMHGPGLLANVIAGVAPLIAAAERARVLAEVRACGSWGQVRELTGETASPVTGGGDG